MARKYLRGLQYTTGTNGRDIPIFMKLCYEFWGYCVNGFNPFLTITNASNSNPIQITTATPHGLVNNQFVGVYNVQGNTAANGGWTVTVVNSTQFNLNGATGNATFSSSPRAFVVVPGAMPAAPVSAPAGFFEGSSVLAAGNDGVTSAIGSTLTTVSPVFNPATMIGKHVVIWSPGFVTSISPASSGQTLPQSTINVNNTTNFPTSGTIYVSTASGTQVVKYNGTTASAFLNCTGGSGTMSTNGAVSSGSSSTDDSIYRILAVPSNTQLILAPYSGGTPDISTLKPNLTSRSNLNYKVIDLIAASQLSVASGNYFVGTMLGPSNINSGQSNSQFQFLLRGSANAFGQLGMVGSPNASWNGVSAFVSAGGASSTITERLTATANSFSGTGSGVIGAVSMWADQDFFISHIRSTNSNTTTGWYFFVTTPLRLYTQTQDPNPMSILVGANALTTLNSNSPDSLATSFYMVGTDGVVRAHRLMTKNFQGDVNKAGTGITIGVNWSLGPNLPAFVNFQERSGQIAFGDALMVSDAAGQYYLNRCKLRPVQFTGGSTPLYHLVGANGEYIHVGNGILLPWDGAVLPYNVLMLGA